MRLSRRSLLRVSATGLAAGSLAGANSAYAQSAGPIKIPLILPLTGPVGIVGEMTRIGAEVAAETINKAGGVLGRPLEIVIRDDKSRPTDATALAREAIGDGMKIFIAGQTTSTGLPIIDVAKELNAVYINNGGQSMVFSRERFARNTFLCSDTEYQRLRGFAMLAAQRFPNVTRWTAILTDSDVYLNSYKSFQKFTRDLYGPNGQKLTFADPIVVKLGTTDFRQQISQLSSSDAEGLFEIVVGSDGVTLWQQARAANLANKFKVIIDQSLEVPSAKALRRNLPANLWTIFMWYPKLYPNNAMSKALQEGWEARTKEPLPSGYVYYGHTPVIAAAEGIKAAGSTDPDKVIAALEGLKFQSCKGEMYFRKEDHIPMADIDYVQLGPQEADPGYGIHDAVVVSGTANAPAPNPGVAFSWN